MITRTSTACVMERIITFMQSVICGIESNGEKRAEKGGSINTSAKTSTACVV